MNPHSADDATHYIGTRLVGGVLSHVWLNGRTIPVLTGGAGDDDGGDGDGDGDGDGSGDDDGDDDGDDEGDGKGGKKKAADDDDDDDDGIDSKNPAIRRASRQAAKYRVRAKAATARAETAETEATALKAEVAKLKKDGAGDDALKTTITSLEAEIATLKADNSKLKESEVGRKILEQVTEAATEFKLAESPKRIKAILREYDMLDVDDEGDIEDLAKSIKKLLKDGELTKKSVSDGDEEDDESGAPSKVGGKSVQRRKTPPGKVDAAALAKKYPALR